MTFAPQPPPGTPPPPQPMYGPPLAMPMPARKRNAFLVWGSLLRIVGAIIGGIAVIWLGALLANPQALVDPLNPFAVFSTIGAIIVIAGISAILVGVGWALQTWGVGWALQTWGVGLVLSFDRSE